jgi:hypothetical protein
MVPNALRSASSLRPALVRPVIASKPAVVAAARGVASSFAPAKAQLLNLDGLRSLRACVVAPPPAKAEPTIINQKLFDYLKANPDVKTVQNLVNKTYNKGTFYSTCKDLGLDANSILKYRTAALMDLAVRPPPGDGTAPRTVEEANRSFITQYQNDTYNRESTNTWSNNCGPTSLAMVLAVNGKLPQGLTHEQSIDYARGLMYPALTKSSGKDVTLPDGSKVRVLDADKMLSNITAATTGAQGGGLAGAQHETGWADFDAALNAGKSTVVEGNISGSWHTVFANHQADAKGNYQGGGNGHFIAVLGKTADGKYLVADPMYTGGTVAMSRDELAVFFKAQNGEPSFVTP